MPVIIFVNRASKSGNLESKGFGALLAFILATKPFQWFVKQTGIYKSNCITQSELKKPLKIIHILQRNKYSLP